MTRKTTQEPGGDVPGDTIASQRAFDRHVYRVGRSWLEAVRVVEDDCGGARRVHRVTLKGQWQPGGGMLVILCADTPERAEVAFHNVDDMAGLWLGLTNRMRNGTMKWREDEYAK